MINSNDHFLIPWIRLAWKSRYFLIALALVLFGSTIYFTKKQKKIYQGTAQIIIELSAPQYLPYRGTEVVSLGSNNNWNTKEFFETQFRIILSRQVSSVVVDKLKLNEDLDFLGIADLPEDQKALALEKTDPVQTLIGQISLDPIADSHVLLIRVKDHQPKRAALIANELALAYQKQNVGNKVIAALEAVKWLDNKVNELKLSRQQAEGALLDFKKENDLLQATLAEKQNGLGLSIREIESTLRTAEQKLAGLQVLSEQLKNANGDQDLSVPDILNNPLIQRLKEQLLTLENQKTALLEQYLEKHPKVKVVDAQIAKVSEALKIEVSQIKTASKKSLDASLKEVKTIRGSLEELKNQARHLQSQELTYLNLEQAVKSTQELYQQMALRLKEAELQAQTEANNIRILDKALVPTNPIAPKLSTNLIVSALTWILLSVLMLLVFNFFDRTLKNTDQIQRDYGITPLGAVPLIEQNKRPFKRDQIANEPDRYILENPNSTVAECARAIRTNLLFMGTDQSLRSLMVTSAEPRDGKTSTCVNIGIALALSGDKILLVDSDLRRPRLNKIFRIANDRGLSNLLMKPQTKLEDVIKPTEIEGMDILCSGPIPPNPAELLQTKAFTETLSRLLSVYDRVIFDSPPVVPVTDAQILGRQLDGTILVAFSNRTHKDMFRKAISLLNAVQVNLLGFVINGIDLNQETYGHYYYQYQSNQSPEAQLEQTFGDDETDDQFKG